MASTDASAHRYDLHDPDVRLMLEVRDDNAAAFEELVLRYQSRVIAVMNHLVNRREQAEDLAQEVFLRVYRARKNYVPNAKFSTWLFTIANNVASNARRGLARRREYNVTSSGTANTESLPGLEEMALEASGLMPARLADHAERAEIVRQAIEALSERQRTALLLAKFEGMSYVDIGEAMGMSEKATKSLIARARDNLRVLLEPYMEDGSRP